MALTVYQQIHQLLEDKKNILIALPKQATTDTIASAVALLLFLEKMGKQPEAVAHGFTLPKTLRFLPKAAGIKPEFGHLQKFMLVLDVAKTGLNELSYDLKDGSLRIHVTPKSGFLTREHIKTAQTDWRYDLIVTIGARDLQSLGELYQENADFFYKTAIVNIDHHPANEHFGAINLVDLTACATAEAVYALIKKLGAEYLDEAIATALLTGIIGATRSFKSVKLLPQTLSAASALMAAGANRDDIVRELYRTRSLGTLQLWGKALTQLHEDKSIELVWSTLTRDDIVRTGASEHDLNDMLDEIMSLAPAAKHTLLLHEHAGPAPEPVILGLLRAPKGVSAKELLAPFQPGGTDGEAAFTITGKSLKQAEEEVLNYLHERLTRQ